MNRIILLNLSNLIYSNPMSLAYFVYSERKLTFTFAICRRPSVCL